MIQLSHVYKQFTDVHSSVSHVLANLSLTIQKGEVFGLYGPSGVGKSTLLRLIPLLEKPDSGKVIVNGRELTSLSFSDLRLARQKIGFVFQQFNLLANRTAFENVALPLEIAGYSKERIGERVKECLEVVGLRERAAHYPAQLSGGQKQRIGIARALASNPEVILADEPTSALDNEASDLVVKSLREINERYGVTIVVVTHETEVIRSLCTRAAKLSINGICEANPKEVV